MPTGIGAMLLIAARGLGLATHITGRKVLIDGFGRIGSASIFLIVTVMLHVHCVAVERLQPAGETS